MSYSPVILNDRPGWMDSVREKLFGDNDTAILPDTMLEREDVVGAAERRVKKRVANYATLTDDDEKEHLKDAAIYIVCAIVCPSVADAFTSEERVGDVVVKRPWMSIPERVKSFEDEAEKLIGSIEGNTTPTATKNIASTISKTPSMFEDV